MKMSQKLSWLFVVALSLALGGAAQASLILGTGAGSLLGGDLTDPDDNGDPEADIGYDVVQFFASEEEGFGGGEYAFNIFDNQVGGGNAKWCCGEAFPLWAGFELQSGMVLTHFTVTSGNDTAGRDPRVWEIQGSNDGTIWDTIFRQDDPTASIWSARNQVILFDAADYAGLGFQGDFVPPAAYSQFRFITFETGLTSGAFFQINEVEFFGVPEPSTFVLAGLGLLGCIRRRRRSRA